MGAVAAYCEGYSLRCSCTALGSRVNTCLTSCLWLTSLGELFLLEPWVGSLTSRRHTFVKTLSSARQEVVNSIADISSSSTLCQDFVERLRHRECNAPKDGYRTRAISADGDLSE